MNRNSTDLKKKDHHDRKTWPVDDSPGSNPNHYQQVEKRCLVKLALFVIL